MEGEGRLLTLDSGVRVFVHQDGSTRLNHMKYPFAKMNPGDHFFEPGGDVRRIKNAAYYYGKTRRVKWKFSVRATPDGVYCWRLK